MIRLSLFNDDLAHTFDKSVEIAEGLGVKYLTLRNVNAKRIGEITAKDIANIKSILKNSSVSISSIGTPVFAKGLTLDNEEMYQEQRKVLNRMFELCDEFGVNTLRVFGFDKPKAEFKDHHLVDHFDQVVEKWEEPVRLAEKAGVVLMFEPEHETYLGTSEDLSKVVKHFNSKAVKVCWDVSNAWNAGDISYPNGYEFVKDDIAHVHVKDAKIDPVTKRVASDARRIGEGDIPWVDIFSTLHKDGYDGFATIEPAFFPWTAELRPYLMEWMVASVKGLRNIFDVAKVPHE